MNDHCYFRIGFLSVTLMAAISVAVPVAAQQQPAVSYELTAGVIYGNGVVTRNGKPVSRNLWMDVYQPVEKSSIPRPAIILSFGGAFHRGNPRLTIHSGGAQDTSMGNYCRRFAARGYTCFAIDYRLMPEGPVLSGDGYRREWIDPDSLLPLLPQANHIRHGMNLPPLDLQIPEERTTIVNGVMAAAEDLREAIFHIREHATNYQIDPERIVIGGFSAGAVTSWNVAHGMGVPVAGLFLLSGSDAGFNSKKTVTAASNRPPILLFMGQYDLPGALDTVPALLEHYRNTGVNYEFAWVPGHGHFYPAGAASLGADGKRFSVEERIVEFVKRVVGKGR